jgi:hypothetical protein
LSREKHTKQKAESYSFDTPRHTPRASRSQLLPVCKHDATHDARVQRGIADKLAIATIYRAGEMVAENMASSLNSISPSFTGDDR